MKNTKDTQISTRLGPLATNSGSPTPLVSVTERESTSDERFSSAVRSPATGWAPTCSPQQGAPEGVLGSAGRWPEHPRACMAARRRSSPWPGLSGGVERAWGIVRASSPCYEPNAPKSKRNEAETSRFRRGGPLRRGRRNSGERFRARGGFSPR